MKIAHLTVTSVVGCALALVMTAGAPTPLTTGSNIGGGPAAAPARPVPGPSAPVVATSVADAAVGAFRREVTDLRRVPATRRPYAVAPGPLRRDLPYDRTGVAMYRHRTTGRLHDHPVVQSGRVHELVSTYRVTGDPRYRRAALAHGERLLERAVSSRGALFFPYPFDFALHGEERDGMRAPWYSAMAQGQALSGFLGLYEITGDARWKTAADRTFDSFLLPRRDGVPWTVYVDSERLLWFEEYARSRDPDRAFNGHMFALFGVYDYWWATGDARARDVVLGGLTASKVLAARFREAGGPSRYCLAHDVNSVRYHAIHIRQLYKLYELTGDPAFARWGDTYLSDAPAQQQGGSGRLARGSHVALTRSPDGAVTATRTMRSARAQSVTVGARSSIPGRPGVWLRIDSGTLAGRWVAERPGVAFVTGVRDQYGFSPARPLEFRPGSYSGLTIATDGTRTLRRNMHLTATSTARTNGRRVVDGTLYYQLDSGTLAGLFVSADPRLRLR